MPCHTMIASRPRPAAISALRNKIGRVFCAKDIEVTVKSYHDRKMPAAGRLLFFSGRLQAT
jgi:hypothetical protein